MDSEAGLQTEDNIAAFSRGAGVDLLISKGGLIQNLMTCIQSGIVREGGSAIILTQLMGNHVLAEILQIANVFFEQITIAKSLSSGLTSDFITVILKNKKK